MELINTGFILTTNIRVQAHKISVKVKEILS
jgi:hypothetical protein